MNGFFFSQLKQSNVEWEIRVENHWNELFCCSISGNRNRNQKEGNAKEKRQEKM